MTKFNFKKLAAGVTLTTTLATSITGCFNPFELVYAKGIETDEYHHYDVPEYEKEEVPNYVTECFTYETIDQKSVKAFYRNNIFVAYRPDTDEYVTYLKYEYDATGSFDWVYHYTQLYNINTLEIEVNAHTGGEDRLIPPYQAVNPYYYFTLVNDWKTISFEQLYKYDLDFELKEAYTIDELKALVPHIIELDKNKTRK